MTHRVPILAVLLSLTVGVSASFAQESHSPGEMSLVDPRIPPATDDEPDAWEYRLSTHADLDGDGTAERVNLLANVALTDAGEPIWDDGQAWEVHVEEDDGTRTRLYARFLQFGKLTARIVEADGGLAVFLVEEINSPGFHLPFIDQAHSEQASSSVGVYEVRYGGPGEVVAVELASRNVEGWFVVFLDER